MHCGLGRNGLHRERGANVRSRVDDEATIGRPCWIYRVFRDKRSGRTTVYRQPEEMWDAVIVYRGSDGLTVGRPCWSALQVQRIGNNPGVCAIGLHRIQKCLPVLTNCECNIPSVGGDCRATKDV